MTTSSAGGFLCGYKPVVLAGSKEPLKIRHAHSYHRQALKGFSLCLVYWLTRKRVYVLFQWHLIIFQILLHLIPYIFFNFLCIFAYCIDIIPPAPEMSVSILLLQICMSIKYHQRTFPFQISHYFWHTVFWWYTHKHMNMIWHTLRCYYFNTLSFAQFA